ncbi:MAG: YceI family protein, partial [Rudanella sp.]|nr:YceI family protein [Rudanella sp.]
MKTRQFLASMMAVAVMAGTSAFVSPVEPVKKVKATTYKVDSQKSILNWEGKKVTGQHNGNVKFTDGTLTVDG